MLIEMLNSFYWPENDATQSMAKTETRLIWSFAVQAILIQIQICASPLNTSRRLVTWH